MTSFHRFLLRNCVIVFYVCCCSFVFSKGTNFHQRRASKILSLIVSLFTSKFVIFWKYYIPQKELKSLPQIQSRIICCASVEVLQTYLACRQRECHTENQHYNCLWNLIQSEKTELEAREILKIGAIVKYISETPVKRLRKNVIVEHTENIASRSFWNEHSCLVKEIGSFTVEINNIKPEFVKSFTFENKLMPSTWIVVRIDGCHFHRFSEIHEFEKPNDEQALNLMNSCAVAVLKELNDIVFSYGVSDEYSFVLKEDSQLYQRRASYIVSAIVSLFSAVYVMQWIHFFPNKELKYTPCFDGRAVCYPSYKILQDYLAWRQVDCHVNNQYNTCFWELVKSGRTKREAQKYLKGTQTNEKYDLLAQQFHIDYNRLPIMFRRGSSVFREQDKDTAITNEGVGGETQSRVVIKHCNIIDCSFWEANPSILNNMSL